MKSVTKNLKKGILMLAMVAALSVFGNSTNNTLRNKDVKKTTITFVNVKKGNVLNIKDTYGTVLYKESIDHSGLYKKRFDLNALPNGDYFFEIDKDLEIQTVPFKVVSNKIIYDTAKDTSYFKPVTRVEDDLVYISKLAVNKESLNVEIYFETVTKDFGLVHSETISEGKMLSRVYKLLNKGNYKIVYHSQGRVYVEYINN